MSPVSPANPMGPANPAGPLTSRAVRVSPLGDRAVLIDVPDPETLPALGAALGTAMAGLGVSVRPGMVSLLVSAPHPDPCLVTTVQDHLDSLGGGPALTSSGAATAIRTHRVPVSYDGADLDDVAAMLGCTARQVGDIHAGTLWRVELVGFAPGFPYLVPEDGQVVVFDVPRMASPRPQVPAGAVAVAAGMSAIYPAAMPGGWRVIGTTMVRLFDPYADQPSLMRVGDLVRFEPLEPGAQP